MYIPQINLQNISKMIEPQKVIIVYGARRVGKTTLIKHFIESRQTTGEKVDYLYVSGDDITVQDYLKSQSIERLKEFVGNKSLLLVDEAQYIPNIGLNLKLIVDNIPGIKVIATGSSSFDLSREVGEPLTGRKYHLSQYPLAQKEISQIENIHETKAHLESRLIFGSYPEVVLMNDTSKRKEYLTELVSSYLFKDILSIENIQHADKLIKLLQLIAYQIGKEVSINELGTQLHMSKNTVTRYLELIEKVFIIFRRTGFSKNMRKVITKNSRYYFLDLGIRNAIIHNFKPIDLRNDIGQLWENYIVAERLKMHKYKRDFVTSYFWRTYSGAEIDLVEEHDGEIEGFEIKWNKNQITVPPKWKSAYPDSPIQVINKENYLNFII